MTNPEPRDAATVSEREIVFSVVIMAATATVLQPSMDTIMKYVGGQIPALQVAWARVFFQMIFTLPIVLFRQGTGGLVPRPLGLQVWRGLFLSGTIVAFTFAIVLMPLADAIALVFIAPLVVTALSAIVLGEVVGLRRWTAVVIGLVGALIIIRPGSGLFGLAAILPLIAALSYACYLIVTRRLTHVSAPMSTHFFTALVGTIALGLPLAVGLAVELPIVTPMAPSAVQWGLLVIVGVISSASHLVIIYAYGRAPVSVLAPLTYLEIVGATMFGYLVFGDLPDIWTLVGVAVIIASGSYVVMRAGRREAAVVRPVDSAR